MARIHNASLLTCIGFLSTTTIWGGCTPSGVAERPKGSSVVLVDELHESPKRYLDREVEVIGETSSTYSDGAFELESFDWIIDDDVLVVTKSPLRFGPWQVRDEDTVIVRGTFREYSTGALQEELGRPVTKRLDSEWKNRYVLVAHTVTSALFSSTWKEPLPPDQRVGPLVVSTK